MIEFISDNSIFFIHIISYILAVIALASILVDKRGEPVSAIGWIMAVIFIPFLGFLLWWAIGFRYLERKKRKRFKYSGRKNGMLSSLQSDLKELPHDLILPIKNIPEEAKNSVFMSTSGNTVDLIIDGQEMYKKISDEIMKARHHIHLLFYIWRNDEIGEYFRDILIQKAREGVEVRVLYDAFGGGAVHGAFMKPLKEAGAKVSSFLPLRIIGKRLSLNFRNHRKIVVIDGHTCFTGGFNIGNEYRKKWHDIGIKTHGPVVDQMQEVFADDWYFSTQENIFQKKYFAMWDSFKPEHSLCTDTSIAVIASGPDSRINGMNDAFMLAISEARERIYIMTPYFIPSDSVITALRIASYKGVDIKIMVPAKSDVPWVKYAASSFYPEILDAGIKIYEYQESMLHAKAAVFDNTISVVGSANFDIRSFKLNFELSCFIGCQKLNSAIASLFYSDMEKSIEITYKDIKKKGKMREIVESVAHLFSPLL